MKKRILVLFVCLLVCTLFLQCLPHGVQATANPTAAGLTEFAWKACNEGWGYVYGTYGQTITQSLIDGKARQYPDTYAEIMYDGRTAYQNAQKWIGHRGADCVGLMKAYLWWQGDNANPGYVGTQDKSANGLYYAATVKGPISTIPNIHGLLVWRDGHIGVYIGNGEVIESRGVMYGVVKTRLSDRGWTNWCKHPSLSYSANGWTQIAGQTYYYRYGRYLTGLQVIDGKTYLLGSDGILLTGFYNVNGKIRYFRADGVVLTGWQTIDGLRYYLDADGVALTGWQQIDGQTCLFNEQGVLLTGWQQLSGGIYYLSDSGTPVTGHQVIGSRELNFDDTGALLNGWRQSGSDWLYYDRSSQPLTGLQLIGGQTWSFDDSGIRQTGWQSVGGRQYYFDPASGAGLDGGLQQIEGEPLLLQTDGSLLQTAGLLFTGNGIYLSDASGRPQSGMQNLNGYITGQTEPVTVGLQFADDFTLQPQNQSDFNLDQTAILMADAADSHPVRQLNIDALAPLAAGSYSWLSLDPEVATVDQTGLVTAAGPGRTLIVVRTDAGAYASCQVAILPDPAVLTAPESPVMLEPGRSADLAITGLPAELLTSCTLTSSNPGVATVSPSGLLLALAAGSSEIQLSYAGQPVLSLTVQVSDPLLGLSASQAAMVIPLGSQAASFASPVPATAASPALTYTSDNPGIAQVFDDGTIKGIELGSTVITAQAGDYSVKCAVTVKGTYPTLRRGISSEAVRKLQQRLKDLGYIVGTVDGQFGPLTEFAVNCYQQAAKIPLTGQANHSLQLAIFSDAAVRAATRKYGSYLSFGDKGESVYVMQLRLFELNYLKETPNSQFDTLTLQAIQTMQKINNWVQTTAGYQTTISRLYGRSVIAGKTTLLEGDSGYEVLLLQTRLKALKYYTGALDSQFTPAVTAAVKAFQIQAKIEVDGEAGTITQQRLFAANAPVCPPPPAVLPTLRLGSTGSAVQTLENRLVALGYHYALANSSYDSLTVNSIKAFQARTGLSKTGVADNQTQVKLRASTAPRSIASFRIGSYGDAVRRIQSRLNQLGYACGTADGRFGRLTDTAARAFQRKAGLSVDGIVGSRTLARLFSATAPRAR